MEDQPIRISVILTVKNGEKFLLQCMESIIGQSFVPHEIVLVDDGSSDQTCNLAASIKSELISIRIIKTSGIGRAKALNLAWRSSVGDWIANIDVDDCWHPNKLIQQLDCLNHHPECAMIFTDSRIILGDEKVCWTQDKSSMQCQYIRQESEIIFSKNPINHSSVLLRKEVLQKLDGYNEKLSKQIDYDLWLRIFSGRYSVYRIPQALAAKRLHESQSFEANKRMYYLLHALKMNYKGLIKLNAPFCYYFHPIGWFLFGLLPRRLRLNIKSFLTR